ncbi:MAG: hypothetical protein IT530_16045 [Burkholderiales bacterium]|nr:hypothetical protein [Burkholderiales bacterium]
MRKIITAFCAVCLLAGCAASPIQGEARPGRQGMFAVATLAPWGTFEHELAAAYTRLAVLRRTAARQLDAQRLPLQQAIDVQTRADIARTLLDEARVFDARGAPDDARRKLAEALRAVDYAAAALEMKQ